jgi:hypothetical protein
MTDEEVAAAIRALKLGEQIAITVDLTLPNAETPPFTGPLAEMFGGGVPTMRLLGTVVSRHERLIVLCDASGYFYKVPIPNIVRLTIVPW